MSLTEQEQNLFLRNALSKLGCPLSVSDRLDAFAQGVRAGIVHIAPSVSIMTARIGEENGKEETDA